MASMEERFAVAVHNTARVWRQAVDRRLRHLGVSQAGWMAIATLARGEEPQSQSALAHKLGVEGPSVVSLVDRLVQAGLVERRPSDQDRRVKHVLLTGAGHELYGKVKTAAAQYRRELLGGIESARLRDATLLLEALHDKIEASL